MRKDIEKLAGVEHTKLLFVACMQVVNGKLYFIRADFIIKFTTEVP